MENVYRYPSPGVWPLSMLVPKVIGPIIKHMNPIMSAFLFLYV